MKTIGLHLKSERRAKNIDISSMEEKTKIKREFLLAIEKENWGKLPEYPVVLGFVKNISKFLNIDESKAVALLRRDYPPQKISINPKPDLTESFKWGPKLTFFLGISLILLIIGGYLVTQYIKFISPPYLKVVTPTQEQVVTKTFLRVSGEVDPEATLKVNNQPVLINDDGTFEAEVEIYEGTADIVFVAVSRAGKQTIISRKIKPELEK